MRTGKKLTNKTKTGARHRAYIVVWKISKNSRVFDDFRSRLCAFEIKMTFWFECIWFINVFRFPHVMTSPLPSWSELVKAGKIHNVAVSMMNTDTIWASPSHPFQLSFFYFNFVISRFLPRNERHSFGGCTIKWRSSHRSVNLFSASNYKIAQFFVYSLGEQKS